MLSLPVYLRNGTYYLHTRVGGLQFKRSLKTADPHIARLRALALLQAVAMTKPRLSGFNFDSGSLSRYELDLQRGIAKSEGPEDHARLLEALGALSKLQNPAPSASLSSAQTPAAVGGLKLDEFLNKFLLLRTLKPASVLAVKNASREFEAFVGKKQHISQILVSDITRFQEHLRTKGNTARTIDGKVAYLKSMLNFAIKQGYLQGKNPCENMSLLTKKQKLTGGYSIFEMAEITKLVRGDYFKAQKTDDPDYYWTVVLAILTGCRVSELTSLTTSQIQKTPKNRDILVIRQAKTEAGKREIPIPNGIFEAGFSQFIDGKTELFRYGNRDGKGSGNAAGKKFSRHLLLEKLTRDKLVFHSLRKFCNDFFMKSGVEFEPRCQFFGHEIDAVNVATYSNKFSADQIFDAIEPSQSKLWELIEAG